MERIYFDNSATTRTDPRALEELVPHYCDSFGNPSSLHSFGREGRKAIDLARSRVAKLLNANDKEIIFTSSGSESDNLAIKGTAFRMMDHLKNHPQGPHIIISPFEHPAVHNTCKYLEELGFKVHILPVDKFGIVDLDNLRKSITESTFLISVIYAHNEIGTIQPMSEIGEIAREKGVIFHTDAVQALGKLPIDVEALKIDLLSFSGHKIYAPKGVGGLYLNKRIRVVPIIHGGGHERGLRSSTENVPGIVALGKTCEIARLEMKEEAERIGNMKGRLIRGILDNIEESYLNGHPTQCLPNVAHFRFTGIEGEALLLSLDGMGIAASTGSACSSKSLKPSRTLIAIGLDPVSAHGSLRLSLGRFNTDDEVDYVLDKIPSVVERLRMMSPLWNK